MIKKGYLSSAEKALLQVDVAQKQQDEQSVRQHDTFCLRFIIKH